MTNEQPNLQYIPAGAYLCDMHYGFQYLPRHLEVVSHTRVDVLPPSIDAAIALLRTVRASVTNKCLYTLCSNAYQDEVLCMYVYDGRYLGQVTVRVKA